MKLKSVLFIVFLCLTTCDTRNHILLYNKVFREAFYYFSERGEGDKIKALDFLWNNLRIKQYRYGKSIDEYNYIVNELMSKGSVEKELFQSVFDSIANARHLTFPGLTYWRSNLDVLSSKDLIMHINAAFRAWELGNRKELSFSEFCEYILPITLKQEYPNGTWMNEIQSKSQFFNETKQKDVYEMCILVNNQLKNQFKIRDLPYYNDLNFQQIDKLRSGKCEIATQYTAYVMRSLGIPVVIDFCPYWGNQNGGHTWNALIYKGRPIPFVGSESDPGKTKIDFALNRRRPKIYRKSFEIQKSSLGYINQGGEEIPQFLDDPFLSDVTDQYIPTFDIKISLYKESSSFKFIFLCVFNKQKWEIVDWGKKKNGESFFKKIGTEVMYLPVGFTNDSIIPVGRPFYISKKGQVVSLLSSSKIETISLERKSPSGPLIKIGGNYEVFYWDDEWRSLGKHIAEGKKLLIYGVPEKTLLWIKSEDKSAKERIFIYENFEQHWF